MSDIILRIEEQQPWWNMAEVKCDGSICKQFQGVLKLALAGQSRLQMWGTRHVSVGSCETLFSCLLLSH